MLGRIDLVYGLGLYLHRLFPIPLGGRGKYHTAGVGMGINTYLFSDVNFIIGKANNRPVWPVRPLTEEPL